MKLKYFLGLACAFLLSLNLQVAQAEQVSLSRTGKLEVLFAPRDDIGAGVVGYIEGAKQRVWIAGTQLTHPGIAGALVRAQRRGLDVKLILDAPPAVETALVKYVRENGVPMWVHPRGATATQNFIVCDTDRIAFGAPYFTMTSADKKAAADGVAAAEYFNLFDGFAALNKAYAAQFMRLFAEAKR